MVSLLSFIAEQMTGNPNYLLRCKLSSFPLFFAFSFFNLYYQTYAWQKYQYYDHMTATVYISQFFFTVTKQMR
jgi:hypothetical protein